jgi:hypothetical protein
MAHSRQWLSLIFQARTFRPDCRDFHRFSEIRQPETPDYGKKARAAIFPLKETGKSRKVSA